jgi:hypothetical protein
MCKIRNKKSNAVAVLLKEKKNSFLADNFENCLVPHAFGTFLDDITRDNRIRIRQIIQFYFGSEDQQPTIQQNFENFTNLDTDSFCLRPTAKLSAKGLESTF